MQRRHFLSSTAAILGGSLVPPAWAAAPKKLRVAVVGHTGRGDYGHGIDTMWLGLPETELVGVADADGKGLAAALKKLHLTQGFSNYVEMLADLRPDILAIGPRRLDEHRDMALAAAGAGVRGIYMEKPFCRTPGEADEIVAACQAKNIKLAVAHRNRYHAVLPKVAGLMQDGTLGRVLEFRTRGKEDQRGGSLDLWVLGCHLFNLVTTLGGPPVACSATVLQEGNPVTRADIKEGDEGTGPLAGNQVHARFELASGIPAFFDSVQNAGTKEAGFGVQIIGTQGVIDLRIDRHPLAFLRAGSPFDPRQTSQPWVPISSAGVGQPEPLTTLGEEVSKHYSGGRDLVAAIREDRPPLCSAEDARLTVEMICAVFESHRQNGARVAWPLRERGNPLAKL